MDNQKFRGILLKLQDRLSDNDRKRLHFFFGNDVPRRIRDDPSLGGTLSLMESLFDQDKINEQDFTVLIKAFKEIRCIDAAKLLQNHMNLTHSTDHKAPLERLSSILPSTPNLLFDDQDDDCFNMTTTNLVYQEDTCSYNNKDMTINPFLTAFNYQKTKRQLAMKGKNFLTTRPPIQICSIIFSIILFIIMTGFYIHRGSRISELETELQMKNKIIIEEQLKNNQTIQVDKALNIQIKDFQKEIETSFTRAGMKFGGIRGVPWDDSFTKNFTCTHYLRGMIARRGFFPSNWFQFIYSSPNQPDYMIKGDVRGTSRDEDISEQFLLDKDEKVYKIQVIYEDTPYWKNNIKRIVTAIRGIRLFTTKGRASPSIDHAEGTKVTEQFDGYTVGYVSGRSGNYLDQIQFHWHRIVADG